MELKEVMGKTKTTNTVDIDKRVFSIEFYENSRWVFEVGQDYVKAIQRSGLYNDKGTLRANFPMAEPEKERELERLRSFLSQNRIPLVEFYYKRKKLDEPQLLRGSAKGKEITNILNRFDSACYQAFKKMSTKS